MTLIQEKTPSKSSAFNIKEHVCLKLLKTNVNTGNVKKKKSKTNQTLFINWPIWCMDHIAT